MTTTNDTTAGHDDPRCTPSECWCGEATAPRSTGRPPLTEGTKGVLQVLAVHTPDPHEYACGLAARDSLLLRSDEVQEALRVAVNLAEREMFYGFSQLLRTLLVEGGDE